MKMDLQKHLKEFEETAEQVRITIGHKRSLANELNVFEEESRILWGEISIYETILRELETTISLLEDMKGANPELLDNPELLEDKP